MTSAISLAGATPLARVRHAHPADLGRALDLGCHGVIVPNVESAEQAAAVAAAWARGDRKAAERAVSDAMIDATSIAGTPDECRVRIEDYRRSGIDLPILSPFARGAGAKARFEAAIRACAPAN